MKIIETSTPSRSAVEDLQAEADLLGNNPEFMRFLEERFAEKATIPLDQLLDEHE